jgi:hypothetical protein
MDFADDGMARVWCLQRTWRKQAAITNRGDRETPIISFIRSRSNLSAPLPDRVG